MLFLLLVFGGGMYYFGRDQWTAGNFFGLTNKVSVQPEVRVDSPAKGSLVTSPLRITGQARGSWFFEASFPVTLVDANDKVLVQGIAESQGDWMTKNFVKFEAKLEFKAPATAKGFLILRKDNPSGLPEHDASFSVPVRFK